MTDLRTKVLEAIRIKAYQEGDFTLSKGQKSDYYIDCKEVTLDAEEIRYIGELIFEKIKDLSVESVGGLELGSVPISSAVSVISAIKGRPINSFIVRKERKGHGLKKKSEGNLKPSMRVVVVDDVVTSGGSSLDAVREIQKEDKVEVVKVISIVDREMGGKEAFQAQGILYEPLFTISEIKTDFSFPRIASVG